MIPQDKYEIAKLLFNSGDVSITKIGELLCINRKELSFKLKEDGLFKEKGYTDNQIKAATILLNNGFNITEVCRVLKVTRSSFAKELEKRNIRQTREFSPSRYDYESEMCRAIVNDYQNGVKRKQIMDRYKISDGLLYNLLRYYNIPLNEEHKRQLHFNEDYFKVIDTEEKAYWLGFLYADGYICNHITYSVELTLKESDEGHLEKFKRAVEYTGSIATKCVTLDQKQFLAKRITLCSKKMVEQLINLGCIQNKSLTLEFPTREQVPDHLIHHFMRGYFDGDGCVVACGQDEQRKDFHFSLLGTSNFLSKYEDILAQNGVNHNIAKKTKSQAYEVNHGGNVQCELIFKFLYHDATIYLERKRDVFIAVLGQRYRRPRMINAELSWDREESEPKA